MANPGQSNKWACQECGLTLRWSRQSPAWHLARFPEWFIIRPAGQAPHRRLRLSSNVSPLMSLIYTEAFAKYGAKLNNQNWSVSAFAPDGSLVVSLWEGWVKRGQTPGTLEYKDTLSKWKGNADGRNELRRHLKIVKNSRAPIRLVLAHPKSPADAALVGEVSDESKINKTFSVRQDVVGTLEEFDDDFLRIVFRRAG